MKTLLIILGITTLISTNVLGQTYETLTAKYKEKPVVEMTLNGQKIWVLLDTGAEISVLSLKSEDKYGFHAYQNIDEPYHVTGFGSSRNDLHQVAGAKLYFGDLKLKSTFFAYDISNITSSIKRRTGKTISAIIGTSLMTKYGFIIDMSEKTITMKYKMKKSHTPTQPPTEIEVAVAN